MDARGVDEVVLGGYGEGRDGGRSDCDWVVKLQKDLTDPGSGSL